MRKLVFAICEQQKRRLAYASAQSDQRLCYSIIPLVSISEISSLELASEAAHASLCLTWSQTPEDRFSRDLAHITEVAGYKGEILEQGR